jgi:hypothetical protein
MEYVPDYRQMKLTIANTNTANAGMTALFGKMGDHAFILTDRHCDSSRKLSTDESE